VLSSVLIPTRKSEGFIDDQIRHESTGAERHDRLLCDHRYYFLMPHRIVDRFIGISIHVDCECGCKVILMKISEKLIRDVMTRGVVTVSADTSVREIAEIMTNRHLSGVVVIAAYGDVLGFISELDIVEALDKPDIRALTAEDIMSSRLIAVAPDATLRQAARIMADGNIHRLLILSEKGAGALQRPVGILSASDIVREVARAE